MGSSWKNPYEINDFSGGITDNVFSGKLACAEEMNNFIILPDKHLLTRPGSQIDDTTTGRDKIPSGNNRIGCIINYAKDDKLFVQSGTAFFYRSGSATGAYSTLQGPSSNPVFNAGTTSAAPSYAEWNRQLFVTNDAFPTVMRIYKDSGGTYRVRNAGVPALATAPTVTPTAGAFTYTYAFVYSYTYTVMTQTFKEISAVTEVQILNAAAPNASAVTISSIPVLTNSGGMNYDTGSIKVEVYRTIQGGTNFYKVGEITNGTTSYVDSTSDVTLQTGIELYINDGTLDFATPPSAKFIHVVGNTGFLGYTKDANGEHPYRVQQSNPTNVNFWPTGFTLDLEEEVRGIKSVANLPIALCMRKIFRIDGQFDSYGRGGMQAVKIHDSAGCVSHLSCVEAEGMLYWWGNDGVYTTDGYTVKKISDHLNTRYTAILAAMAAQKRIYGKFDYINRRIYWGVESDATNLENDTVISLDLRWGISNEMSFTSWSGTSFRPTALEIFNGSLYRADDKGFCYKHDASYTTDPKRDTLSGAATWHQESIIWNYQSLQLNFGSSFNRKIVSRCLLQAGNAGDTNIQINAINDQGKSTRALKLIRWKRNFVWRADTFVWGSADCIWRAGGLIDQWRRFPANGLRLSYLQMQITNGLGLIANSDTYGLAAINKTSKTVTLSGSTWPTQGVDYYIAFANDNYTRLFQITALDVTGAIATVSDSGNNLPASASGYKWEVFGYEKGDALNLLGFNLHWDNIDQNQGTYQGATGGNA